MKHETSIRFEGLTLFLRSEVGYVSLTVARLIALVALSWLSLPRHFPFLSLALGQVPWAHLSHFEGLSLRSQYSH
jgi:hypothetical protein